MPVASPGDAGPGRPTAVELGAYATTQALTSLLDAGHEVGLAIVGIDGDGPAGLTWLRRRRTQSAVASCRTATGRCRCCRERPGWWASRRADTLRVRR